MLVVKTGIRNGKRQEPKECGAAFRIFVRASFCAKNDIKCNSNGSIRV